jgi:hypothetical protein
MSDAEQCLALELAMYRLLDFAVGCEIYLKSNLVFLKLTTG